MTKKQIKSKISKNIIITNNINTTFLWLIERSHRITLKQKYKIQKKIREHHRKLRKEAKKAQKSGLPIKRQTKVTRLPNLYPKKKEEIEAQDLRKELEKLTKKKGAIITEEDIKNMVKESSGTVISS